MPLSRTYRPKQFKDVSGQQHVTETLRREVAGNMIGHAYLFSGPRGVGKTTSARIFANALLCEQPNNGEPCTTCAACLDVASGNCIDIMEVDAASHTGVDNVREAIIEHVRFGPARWKRKVYIIDEAHMLSTSAWNALLKTLEEPPAYAVFMLATTELHKVPATIQSRCQRFAFHRISAKDLSERVRFLAAQEKLQVDDDVVTTVARAADGYVRDAESLMEQLMSLGETHITSGLASLMIPPSRMPDAAGLFHMAGMHQTGAALKELRRLLEDGGLPLPLFDDLLAVVRLLIRCEDPAEAARLKEGDAGEAAVHKLIGCFSPEALGRAALIMIDRRRDAKSGIDPTFALELALVMIASDDGLAEAPASSGRTRTTISAPPSGAPHDTVAGGAPHSVPASEGLKHLNEKAAEKTSLEETAAPVPETGTGELAIHDVHLRWREVIRLVERENRSLPFILKIAKPESIRGTTVVIRFSYPFHQEKIIGELKNKRVLEGALRNVLKREDILVDGVVGETLGQTDRPGTTDIVSKVLNAFGGSVVE